MNNKKRDNPRLKWIVGLEFAAIIIVGVMVIVLALSFNWSGKGSFATQPAVLTLLPQDPTSISQPTSPTESGQLIASTAISTLPVANFDPSTANQVAPADVLREIDFFPGGDSNVCPQISNQQPFWPGTLDEVTELRAEWFSPVWITSCGWQAGELVLVTITYQGENYWSANQTANESVSDSGAQLWFSIPTPRELGSYTVSLDAPSGHLEAKVNIYLPSTPRLYSVGDAELALYNFVPGETIRLFAYHRVERPTIQLAGWSEYQIKSSAPLIFRVSNEEQRTIYYVVGSVSGLVADGTDIEWWPGRSILIAPCGGPPSYLSRSDTARVSTADNSTADIRSEPGYLNEAIAQIPAGTPVKFQGDWLCMDNALWWHVSTDDGQNGWMPEEQNGVYLLEPIP